MIVKIELFRETGEVHNQLESQKPSMMSVLHFYLLRQHILQHYFAKNEGRHVKNYWAEINPTLNLMLLLILERLIKNKIGNLTT